MTYRLLLLTVLTLTAFASNSVLCRLALVDGSIDAASFTWIRLVSGAIVLVLVASAIHKKTPWGSGSWLSGLLLFSYAAAFSYSYINISAGTGGLILFGCVQFTMIAVGIAKGERPGLREWLGLAIALIGLLVLVSPGLHAPPPISALLMAMSGVSWGFYSLRGRSVKEPTLATGDNFIRAVPFALVLGAVAWPQSHAEPKGIVLAITSGAITSGLGYVLWYSVLPHLTAARAAITQLAVPALVAIGGVLFLAEVASLRLVIATVLLLGGVAMAVLRRRVAKPESSVIKT